MKAPDDVLARAKNPKTGDKALATLATAHPRDLELARAIATHPNASVKTLGEILCRAPDEVVRHPAFTLCLLGGEKAIDKLPRHGLVALVARRLAPPEIVAYVERKRRSNDAEGFAFALGLASDIAADQQPSISNFRALRWLAEALSEGPELDVSPYRLGPAFDAHDIHADEGRLRPALLAIQASQGRAEAQVMLEGLARNPATTAAIADEALRVMCRLRVTSGRLYEDLSALAGVAAELLGRGGSGDAARDPFPDAFVRAWGEAGADLGPGRDGVVRGAIVAGLRCGLFDAAALEALLLREGTVRRALAMAGPVEGKVGESLASDPDPRVRVELAGRPDLPLPLVQRLAADEDAAVRTRALAHPRCPAASIVAALSATRRIVRRSAVRVAPPALLADAQNTLIADSDGLVRTYLAERADAPESMLHLLAGDRSPTVRRAVAKNPATSAADVATLADDPHPRVREGVAKRPKRAGR